MSPRERPSGNKRRGLQDRRVQTTGNRGARTSRLQVAKEYHSAAKKKSILITEWGFAAKDLRKQSQPLTGYFQPIRLGLMRHFAIDQAPDAERVRVLQFIWQSRIREILITDWPGEAI